MGSMVGMIEVDWSEWWLISAIAFVFLMIGGVTGFRAGRVGLSIKQTMVRAIVRGGGFVVVATTLVAAGMAFFQLFDLGVTVDEYHRENTGLLWNEYSHVTVHSDGIAHGLRLDYQSYWEDAGRGPCIAPWCRCPWCSPMSPLDLNQVVDERIAMGALWAFLAPMWIIFGSIPLLGAATVGFSMGAVRRNPAMEG